jgi:uncharacterized protein Usg
MSRDVTVQVLDGYGLKSGKATAAAIYNIAAPKVNACKAQTIWQSYDIEFTAPVFDGKKKTKSTRMTVYHDLEVTTMLRSTPTTPPPAWAAIHSAGADPVAGSRAPGAISQYLADAIK